MLQEYELARRMLEGRDGTADAATTRELQGLGRELLRSRDRFIAGQIDRTLGPGETGLVFLGMLHDLGPHLPHDLRVERLDVVATANDSPRR